MELAKVFVPLVLAIMMLGMGLSLKVDDFKRIVLQPKVVLLGSAFQIVLLPLICFALISVFDMSPAIALGFMILGACPGGPGSNLLAFLCRGDAALSVTLTAISSVLAFITIPLVVGFSIDYLAFESAAKISVAKTTFAIFFITVVPVIIGMFIASKRPAVAEKCEKPVKIASIIFLLFLVLATFIKEWANLSSLIPMAGIPAVALSVFTFAGGFLLAKVLKLSGAVCKTICIELGIQNGALAIVIATSILDLSETAIPAAIYSPVMITISLGFLLHALLTKSAKQQQLQATV